MTDIDIPRTRPAFNRLLQNYFPFFLQVAYAELDRSEPMIWNWHLDAMCYALDQIYQGHDRRLVITIPPRHLKTITCSIAFVAWVMGLDPAQKFICVSYSVELAVRFSRSFRQLVESDWYRRAFPDFQIARATDISIETTAGGYRNATSVNGTVTGTGATYIVIDDISKGVDSNSPQARDSVKEFYRNSLVSRFNNPTTGRIIVIGQRIHEDDFPGYCIETGTYRHLNLPGIAQKDEEVPTGPGESQTRRIGDLLDPLRFPQWKLDELEHDMTRRHFYAQILQDPASGDSDYFTWARIRRYNFTPERHELQMVVQSWDTAHSESATADYSVCTTWGYLRGKWLLLHVYKFKKRFVELMARLRVHRDHWRADLILIENSPGGSDVYDSLVNELRTTPRRQQTGWRVHGITASIHKNERWAAQAAKLEDGTAILPIEAEWMEEFRRELCAFPLGRKDDQVDSVSQFLDWTTWGRSAVNLEIDNRNGPDERFGRQRINPRVPPPVDDETFWSTHLVELAES